ncbi:hypothetical protein TNCV_40461 [Trichonephila clavipes]|nr:hypothetical protein TNCV_40461 [Trichonephila clavipes]
MAGTPRSTSGKGFRRRSLVGMRLFESVPCHRPSLELVTNRGVQQQHECEIYVRVKVSVALSRHSESLHLFGHPPHLVHCPLDGYYYRDFGNTLYI